MTTQPLLADYVKHNSKGFAGGITSLLSGFGAIFAVFVLMKMRGIVSFEETYFIAAGLSLFVSIFCLYGVKNVVVENSKNFMDRM